MPYIPAGGPTGPVTPIAAQAGGGPWNPGMLANLAAWWKFDGKVSPVTSVSDFSPSGYNLVNGNAGTVGVNTLNGVTVLDFTAANAAYLRTALSVMNMQVNTYTFYAVVSMRGATQNNGRAVSFASATSDDFLNDIAVLPCIRDSLNNNLSAYKSNVQIGISAVTLGVPHRYGIVGSGTVVTAYMDGVASGGTVADSFLLSNVGSVFLGTFNHQQADGATYWDGIVGEVVITKGNNTADVLLGGNLDNYFKARFGL